MVLRVGARTHDPLFSRTANYHWIPDVIWFILGNGSIYLASIIILVPSIKMGKLVVIDKLLGEHCLQWHLANSNLIKIYPLIDVKKS